MRERTVAGGIILIIGFLLYQTGIVVNWEYNELIMLYVNRVTSYLSITQNTFILFSIYVGGIIAIIGFLLCISSMSAKEMVPILRETPETQISEDEDQEELKCRFCNESLSEEDIFCPNCNRAIK